MVAIRRVISVSADMGLAVAGLAGSGKGWAGQERGQTRAAAQALAAMLLVLWAPGAILQPVQCADLTCPMRSRRPGTAAVGQTI